MTNISAANIFMGLSLSLSLSTHTQTLDFTPMSKVVPCSIDVVCTYYLLKAKSTLYCAKRHLPRLFF